MNQKNSSPGFALIFRSLAIFLILYQFRLIAADMADTLVFVTAILAAFAAAGFLGTVKTKKIPGPLTGFIGRRSESRVKACFRMTERGGTKRFNTPRLCRGRPDHLKVVRPGAGLCPAVLIPFIILTLIPWLTRFIIALPGIFFRNSAASSITISLDSLLLNFDRNNFISLLPFYWAAWTSWFSLRSQKFLRSAIIADAVLLLAVYCVVRTADIDMYRWPIVMILVFAGIVFLQALALLFSLPKEVRLRSTEKISAILVITTLIILGGWLFLGPAQRQALEKGGGLLEPKLFSFDFSQFLKLDPEISMGDDLIMIVRKESKEYDDHILLRRSVLSGYGLKQGFYRIEDLDEQTHPQRLPGRPTELTSRQNFQKAARLIKQEYFLVNFDAAAFIGMNQPVSVTPYENWDASSFRSAFMVDSLVCNADWFQLSRSAQNWPGREELGLNEAEFKIYTEYGGDERIREYAQELTRGMERYNDKIVMIHNRLKYGEYRYSLKPGIAPDGDQLGWFLFNTKKGYCTYYAFAMTLMLRSLGIPARTAAGFFIDPETNTFDYYPVRSDMAHAWVEVLYPDYGWIEFDPTSENLAEGEEFSFSKGVDPNLFEKLMREILENRRLLRVKEGRELSPASPASSIMRAAAAMLKTAWPALLLIILAVINITIRCRYLIASALRRNAGRKAVRLWKHCRRRLRLAGIKPSAAAHESEYAHNADARIPGVYLLYQCAAAARFAPAYSADDFARMQNQNRAFSAAYRQAVSPLRRILSWVLPVLALLLPARGKTGGGGRPRKKKRGAGVSLILPLLLLFVMSGSDTAAQEAEESLSEQSAGQDLTGEDALSGADLLYESALNSIYSENWERAIENLKTGGKLYPDDERFPRVLGNLYHSRSLYNLAWDEFKKVEAIDRFDVDNILMLAYTAGLLNKSHISIEYHQKALMLNPENIETISSLGWMYYKVHRLTEGEKLLTDAIEQFGEEADFAMTLGTLYSAMYNYEKSKYWYQKAISLGRESGDMNFTAVAHYNLSILESRFYHYDLSMNETNASLNARRRASGLLARGELNMRRLELKQSQADYQAAYELDTSPLAKLSLAQIYQISGRLEEARLYAEDCLKAKDHSWMLNFGIDPDRYTRDIHEILYETYEGLGNSEALTPWGRPGEKARSLFKRISYWYKSLVHRRLYEKYSLAAADSYRAELSSDSPLLDSTLQYFNSFKRYKSRAQLYLDFARELETAFIPASVPAYDADEGMLKKDARLLEQALAGLNPQWESMIISECYKEIARSAFMRNTSAQTAFMRIAAEELFALNHGGLRQAGIRLPVHVDLFFASENFPGMQKCAKILLTALEKTGFSIANNADGESSRYKLQLNINGSPESGYSVLCELTDTQGIGRILHRSLPLRDLSRPAIYDFARNLGNTAFKVE